MIRTKTINTKKGKVLAISTKLCAKTLILFKGKKGYIMCGYLNLAAASKFSDIAAKIVKISTIEEALKTTIHSSTKMAKKAGIYKGMPVKEALEIIS